MTETTTETNKPNTENSQSGDVLKERVEAVERYARSLALQLDSIHAVAEEIKNRAAPQPSGLAPAQLAGVRQCVLNLANIFLRTGNHEVRVAVKEVARGFCYVIGESHAVFFPDAPNSRAVPEPNAATVLPGAPGPGFPMAAQVNGMAAAVAAQMPAPPSAGLAVPGMPPSPFAIPSQQDPQGSSHPALGSPSGPGASPGGAQGECRMEVVSDPAGQMTPSGGPPAGTPGLPGSVPMPQAPVIPGQPQAPQYPYPQQAPPAQGQPEPVSLDQLAAQFAPMGEPPR